jgi:predicted nucleic acid-binding protein
MDPLPFDAAAARAYARVYAATRSAARTPRGSRAVDLMIASVALARDLPLYTLNGEDFEHLRAAGLDLRAL